MTDLAGAWLHCSTAARNGCGCTRCTAWRKALTAARTGNQPTPTLFDTEQ